MKNRIKEIRNSLKLSQKKFAAELGVSCSNIESYEMGRRNPSDAFIQLVCNKYLVNETWLRDGTGEMFGSITREQEIAQITAGMFKEENDFKRELLKLIAQADEKQIEVIREMVRHLSEFTD